MRSRLSISGTFPVVEEESAVEKSRRDLCGGRPSHKQSVATNCFQKPPKWTASRTVTRR
jgi:hypothetical protein